MIVQPSWAKDAVPTPRGWASPKGELLKSGKISQSEIDEWNAKTKGVAAAPAPAPKPEVLKEAPVNDKDLTSYSKSELLALGSQYGLDLDRSMSKSKLAEELEDHLLAE